MRRRTAVLSEPASEGLSPELGPATPIAGKDTHSGFKRVLSNAQGMVKGGGRANTAVTSGRSSTPWRSARARVRSRGAGKISVERRRIAKDDEGVQLKALLDGGVRANG
jgi:hypothetical protein